MRSRSRLLTSLILLLPLVGLHAQESPEPAGRDFSQDDGLNVATVSMDGLTIVRVRGIAPDPARDRAERIRQQIVHIAADRSIDAGSGRLVASEGRITILFGDQPALTLYSADADLEAIPLDVLAEATRDRVQSAIDVYRDARSKEPLLRSTAVFAGVTAVAVLVLLLVLKLFSWLGHMLDNKVKVKVEELDKASHRVLGTEQFESWSDGLLRGFRFVAVIAILLTWLSIALGIYPWTRPFASSVYRVVLDPLRSIGLGMLGAIPDIVFIVVLVVVVRFALRVARTFFDRVDRGWIRLANFDREWAVPTYRILRILVIAFAIVVAYPYIPGSSSDAFKGVSLFLGVIFSIGSSSFIGNIIAGYSLTYRRAFRPGDRVSVGELVGDVLETRVLSTRLRSIKNEEINIPNAQVLGSHVVNYSSLQRERGLILHTRIGIGYDVPWRQVEAMLLLAAQRADGIHTDPAPFVLQIELGDFAVLYELNAYCSDAQRMALLYTELHRHIQDVFNEYGVQIMSPRYEDDPATPKVVKPGHWYPAPAARDTVRGENEQPENES